MVMSFCAVLFPRGVLDEILNLIESVSEGFPSDSSKQEWVIHVNKVLSCKCDIGPNVE